MNLHDKFVARYGRLPTELDPDYLEMLRMSKYGILDAPTHKPGKCANCGSSKIDGRKYVDFKLEIDWYGIVYLCSFCLLDIANNAGLFAALESKLEAALNKIEEMEVLSAKGEDLQVTLIKTLEEYKKYYEQLNLFTVGNADSRDDTSNSTTSVGVNSGTEKSTSGNGTSTRSKSRITESVTGSGRKDIPNLADLLNPSK